MKTANLKLKFYSYKTKWILLFIELFWQKFHLTHKFLKLKNVFTRIVYF